MHGKLLTVADSHATVNRRSNKTVLPASAFAFVWSKTVSVRAGVAGLPKLMAYLGAAATLEVRT